MRNRASERKQRVWGRRREPGFPIPPGVALSGSFVDAVAAGSKRAIEQLATAARSLVGPLAVRSSAVDEDGADASFAGQHLTLLNVPSVDDLSAAIREIWWSANSDSAITYRQRVGLFARPSVGVVVQSLLDPDVAGVMFTQNPINEADERLIEASWGLGEVVVAGRVIPDSFRFAPRRVRCSNAHPASRRSRSAPRPTAAPSTRPSRPNSSSSCASTTINSHSSTRLLGGASRSTDHRRVTSNGRSRVGSCSCCSAAP